MTVQLHQQELLISGMMCYGGCGVSLANGLMDKNKIRALLPDTISSDDIEVLLDAEPAQHGKQLVTATLISSNDQLQLTAEQKAQLSELWLKQVPGNLTAELVTEQEQAEPPFWDSPSFNLGVSIATLAILGILAVVFPPSIPLTIALSVVTFIGTAISAREYIGRFFKLLFQGDTEPMAAAITTGVGLTTAHMIYHDIQMPMAASGAMVGMNFLMPPALMACVSGMDMLREHLNQQQQQFTLSSRAALFPELNDYYHTYEISDAERQAFEVEEQRAAALQALSKKAQRSTKVKFIRPGQIMAIPPKSCFPVNCTLLSDYTNIDASNNNGEIDTDIRAGRLVQGGSLNNGDTVYVRAEQDYYNSEINKVLLRAGRALPSNATEDSTTSTFTWIYGAAIFLGVVAAISMPYVLGAVGVGLILQNLAGLFFAICPCTIALGHYLPKLSALKELLSNGILFKDEQKAGIGRLGPLCKTLVLDKTGTLTLGKSTVNRHSLADEVLHQVAALEYKCGRQHPLGRAIIDYAAQQQSTGSYRATSVEGTRDPAHRGLIGAVDGEAFIVGNANLMQDPEHGITGFTPAAAPAPGLTPVYVAKDNRYVGCIYLASELRPGIREDLMALRRQGVTMVMVTGDTHDAATAFCQQLPGIFDPQNIHANQTPQDKEATIKNLLHGSSPPFDPASTWVVGDGFNDSLMLSRATELGATSAAISDQYRAAFFADVTLNGRLDYLILQPELDEFIDDIKQQNRALLIGSSLFTTAALICTAIAGIGMPMLLPLLLMIATTSMIIGNSMRVQLKTDALFNSSHKPSWPDQFFASHACFAVAAVGSGALLTGLLINTVAVSSFALPSMAITAGITSAVAGACVLSGGILLGVIALGCVGYAAVKLWEKYGCQDDTPAAENLGSCSHQAVASTCSDKSENAVVPTSGVVLPVIHQGPPEPNPPHLAAASQQRAPAATAANDATSCCGHKPANARPN